MSLRNGRCDDPSCPWKKPSLAFFHLSNPRNRRGFAGLPIAASCGGGLFPQSASRGGGSAPGWLCLVGLLAGLSMLSGADRLAAESVEVLDTRVISPADRYCGWPTIGQTASGELLVVCSGGRESHVCPFGRVELLRSTDGGQHWTWPRVLHDGPIDDRDAGICVTSQGTILVTTFTSLAYEPILKKGLAADSGWPAGRRESWQRVHARLPDAARETELGCWMLRSEDGGRQFSAAYRVPLNSPHGPVALADGSLLYAGVALWTADRRVGVCQSRDDGKTWEWLAEIPVRAGDNAKDYHELHAVETADGRLLVQIRNHNQANRHETLQCESRDGGRTWTEPHSIGVWGYPSHLLRLRDGRLLMSYGHRRKPLGVQARISIDHGETWGEPLVITADGHSSDLGYPATVETAPGVFVTVWYEKLKESGAARLRQARWRLADGPPRTNGELESVSR